MSDTLNSMSLADIIEIVISIATIAYTYRQYRNNTKNKFKNSYLNLLNQIDGFVWLVNIDDLFKLYKSKNNDLVHLERRIENFNMAYKNDLNNFIFALDAYNSAIMFKKIISEEQLSVLRKEGEAIQIMLEHLISSIHTMTEDKKIMSIAKNNANIIKAFDGFISGADRIFGKKFTNDDYSNIKKFNGQRKCLDKIFQDKLVKNDSIRIPDVYKEESVKEEVRKYELHHSQKFGHEVQENVVISNIVRSGAKDFVMRKPHFELNKNSTDGTPPAYYIEKID